MIDPDSAMRRLLRRQLESDGHAFLEAIDGRSGLALAAEQADLVVLELVLPDMQGLDVLREMRQRRVKLPIIVLSSIADENLKVEALDLGADDYVTKPFGMAELLARVRGALRRGGDLPPVESKITIGGLSLDQETRVVMVRDEEAKLSRKEYRLLEFLMEHAGKPLSHSFLLRELWGIDTDPQLLRVFVRALRRKIEVDPEHPSYILTERGFGYRFRSPD